MQAGKRAHHNALERKRRDHIKDSFSSLRDSVPALHGEKVVRNLIVFTPTPLEQTIFGQARLMYPRIFHFADGRK